MGTLVVAIEVLAIGGFDYESLAGWSNNLSPDLGGKEESRRVTKGVTEGATEGRSRQKRARPWIKVILELISSKNTLLNELADLLGIEKLEL